MWLGIAPPTGESELVDFTMHRSQRLVKEPLPYPLHFAEMGELASTPDRTVHARDENDGSTESRGDAFPPHTFFSMSLYSHLWWERFL